MKRKVNKGVSMVEILFALAVFMIMMIPLVASIISGIRMSTQAKETQQRNEYVQNLMENVKDVSIDVLKDATSAETFFKTLGAEDITVTGTSGAVESYSYTGTTYLGATKTKYSFQIDLSRYKTSDAAGIVQSLDQTNTAIISDALSNYDAVAQEALLTRKINLSTTVDDIFKGEFSDMASTNIDAYRRDKANRNIVIKVSGSKAAGYDVVCEVTYTDQGTVRDGGNPLSVKYTIYNQFFKNLPNVYLMYNVGVYNAQYTTDTITYDLSGLNEPINIFVVETSAELATDIQDLVGSDNSDALKKIVDENRILYQRANSTDRNETIYMNALSPDDKLKLYYSFEDTVDTSGISGAVVVSDDFSDAQDEIWKLYDIKIWMQQGDTVSTDAKFVILQGTRGGGEFD